MRFMNTRNTFRNDWLTTNSDYNRIIVFLIQNLLRARCIQLDHCALLFALFRSMKEPLQIILCIHFKRRCLGTDHISAKLTALFIQGNIMPAVKQSLHCLDAARAAANDCNPFLLCSLRNKTIFQLAGHSGDRIDRTVDRLRNKQMLHTGVAPETWSSVFRPVFCIFSRHVRIRHQRSAHGHKVCPAVCNDLFRIINTHNRSDCINKQIRITLFHITCKMHIKAVIRQIVLTPVVEVFHIEIRMKTCGNVKNINMILQVADQFQGFIKVHSFRRDLICGNTIFDYKILSAVTAD